MYRHLRPPDAMPLSIRIVRVPAQQLLNFYGLIFIRYAAPPYFASTVIIASVHGRWTKTPILFQHLA